MAGLASALVAGLAFLPGTARAQFINVNAARFDAMKHQAFPVVGDALESISEIDAALEDWAAPAERMAEARAWYKEWNDLLDEGQTPTNQEVPSYAQVVGIVNKMAKPEDVMVTAAGGLPGETSATDSALLRIDNRGVCEVCHQK